MPFKIVEVMKDQKKECLSEIVFIINYISETRFLFLSNLSSLSDSILKEVLININFRLVTELNKGQTRKRQLKDEKKINFISKHF